MKKFNSYKNWMNEKFTEDSDPIKDMGIGMDAIIKNWVEKENSHLYIEEDLLWICAAEGKVDFVKYLLTKGYDVHKLGDYALRWAALRGHENVVKILLDAGANVHTDNDYPLTMANKYRHKKTIEILKDHIVKEKGTEKNKTIKENLLFEKFTEDSDPIKDMGIGAINLYDKAIELTKNDWRRPQPWLNYLGSLKGKTIYGKFKLGKYLDVTNRIVTKKFKIADYASYYSHRRFLFLIDEKEKSYYVLEDQYYAIA